MSQQSLNVGAAANDHTGDPLRTAFQKTQDNFTDLYALQSRTVNAGDVRFQDGPTTEARIQSAITQAVAEGANRVFIPATMLPYNAASVNFDSTVQMIREGGSWNLYEAQAYGAAGDDVQDDTAAFQAANDQANINGGTFYIADAEVAYRIDGTVTISGNNRRFLQEPGGLIKAYSATGPAFLFAGVSATMKFLRVDGLRVTRAAAAYRIPLVQFGDANGLSYFSARNVFLDGANLAGDGLWLHSCFNSSLQDVTFQGQTGINCVYRNDPSLNVGNINFINWSSNSGPIMFAVQEYYGLSDNLINSLHFDNCKHALGATTWAKFYAGTSDATVALGATAVQLTAGQGSNYVAGDWVTFVSGSKFWADKIASVSTDTLNLTATAGLPFALAAGDPCINGGWQIILGSNVKSVECHNLHWERVNGLLGIASQAVGITNPYLGANINRGAYLVKSCQQWRVERPKGALTASGVLLHQANDSNNSRNSVKGCSTLDVSTGTILQADGGSLCAQDERFGMTESLLGVWHQDTTVTTNQANVQLTGPSGAVRGLRMRTRGSIAGILAQVSTSRTSGSLTVVIFKNGSQLGSISAVIDGANATWKATESQTALSFVSGDIIDVRITTDGTWAPTSNNLDVSVYGTI